MRISGDSAEGVLASQTSRLEESSKSAQGARAKDAGVAAADGDSIQISDLSATVMEAARADETRTSERISQLAGLYAKGEYRPDSAALSRALVSHALSESVKEGE